jgi:hypothetical protein
MDRPKDQGTGFLVVDDEHKHLDAIVECAMAFQQTVPVLVITDSPGREIGNIAGALVRLPLTRRFDLQKRQQKS